MTNFVLPIFTLPRVSMIAIKERLSPPTWSADGERTVAAWSRATMRRRGPLVVDFCGVLVFFVLMAAYVLWA